MNILEMEKQEGNRVTLSLQLEEREWRLFLEKAAQDEQPENTDENAPSDGENALTGEALYAAAAALAGPEAVAQACADRNLSPVSEPEITAVQADEAGYACTAAFINYPEIEHFAWQGLKAERPERIISQEDIDREEERYMATHLNIYETDREARLTDRVEIRFSGTTDEGKSFPFDHSSNKQIILGQEDLFAGLDEALLGKHIGDEFTVTLTMPEDFHRKNVAGLTLVLTVGLQKIWARERCELTDEFVKDHVKDCDTVEAFRAKIREKLADLYERTTRKLYTENLQKAMAEAVRDEVPEVMVETAMARMETGLARRASAHHKSVEELLSEGGRTPEEYRAEALEYARYQACYSVALDTVISQENIEVSQEELTRFCSEYSRFLGITPEDVRHSLGGKEGTIEEIQNRKAMEMIEKASDPQVVQVTSFPGEDVTQPRLTNL